MTQDVAERHRAERPRIDPRIRQRRIQVKRDEGRRRLWVLTASLGVVVVLAVTFIAVHSPLAAVRHVHIAGNARTSADAIESAAGVARKPPMIDVDPGAAAAAVRRLPWIATATVRRQWPATIDISVTERRPVAVVGFGTPSPVMVDASGRIVSLAGGINLPVVITDGDPALGGMPGGPPPAQLLTVPAPGPPGSQIDAAYAPGIAVASDLTPTLLARLTKIVVSADGTVRLGLIGGASALLGTADDVGDKLTAVETLLDRTTVGRGRIDVTVPSAPVVSGG